MVTPTWLHIAIEGEEDDNLAFHQFIRDGLQTVWKKTVYNWANSLKGFMQFSMAVFYSTHWLGVLITPIFFIARVLIVIMAFTSLRSVPAGVYADVPWTEYVPHV